MNTPIPTRIAERAAGRYTVEGECWVSTYSHASHGYSQVGGKDEDGKTIVVLAHRAAWVHTNGPIPDGLTIDHRCFNKRCVRPDHLRLLTRSENARRNAGRDFPLGECAHGHSLRFMLRLPNGRTRCALCRSRIPRSFVIDNKRVPVELLNVDEFRTVVERLSARRSFMARRRAQQMADLCFALHGERIPIQMAVAS